MSTGTTNTDIVSKIIAYESGEMDEEEETAFFQEIVRSGLVWQLQGQYQRTALTLLKSGKIHAPAWFGKGGEAHGC